MSARCPLCRQVPATGREQAELGLALHTAANGTIRERLLTLLGRFGGLQLTAEEAARALRKAPPSVGTELERMRRRGLVQLAGERRTASGRRARVFALKAAVTPLLQEVRDTATERGGVTRSELNAGVAS